MAGTICIRLATEADAPDMLTIYAPVVRETAISFELDPPSVAEFSRRVRNTLPNMAWLVCEIEGRVAGYAYAGPLRSRLAYQWSVETTVYVRPDFYRFGVGTAVYTSLFACLRIQGYRNAYGGIALPNPASVALHERLGFTHIGTYRKVGYKLGAWHDVGWWQLELAMLDSELDSEPKPPTPLSQIDDTKAFRDCLTRGMSKLRL